MIGFRTGETVLLRSFRHSDPSALSVARPGRVIFDDDRGLMTWTGAGWPHVRQRAADGSTPRTLADQRGMAWEMAVVPWSSGTLTLTPHGRTHAVWWFFAEDGRFDCWYVNLEERQVRWRTPGVIAGGIDTSDNELDIIGERRADGNAMRWKDEELFAERIGHPWYWDADAAAAIRAEGERVAAAMLAATFPFDGSFADFHPDPDWTAPEDLSAAWLPRATRPTRLLVAAVAGKDQDGEEIHSLRS